MDFPEKHKRINFANTSQRQFKQMQGLTFALYFHGRNGNMLFHIRCGIKGGWLYLSSLIRDIATII